MGRWQTYNYEADYLPSIKIWELRREGWLNGFRSGILSWKYPQADYKNTYNITVSTFREDMYLRIQFAKILKNGQKQKLDYKISLATSICNYGGKRFWFICPLMYKERPCKRIVGVLYFGGDYLGCRQCYNLTYSSRRENRSDRFYPLFRSSMLRKKVSELVIKRLFYAGKPTKKFIKGLKILQMIKSITPLIRQ